MCENADSRPVLLVDGLNVFMRHFCANPSMADTGEHVGGLLGFFGAIGSLCETFHPRHVVIVWESGGSARQHAGDATHKDRPRARGLNRYYGDDMPQTAENHAMQVSLLVKVLAHLPVVQIYVRDCEADEVVGYLIKRTFETSSIILVSSNRDLYQLIDDRVRQWSPGQKRLIDCQHVLDKFGVTPENFCTARAFVGDSSDGILGVRGVGFKFVSKRFPQLAGSKFVSCGDVIDAAESVTKSGSGKTMRAIVESRDLVSRNWKLMRLDASRLSQPQVRTIEEQLKKTGKSDKMALMRTLYDAGIRTFDIDRHFAAVVLTQRHA